MNLVLTWDLFVVVFFATIIGYSFIIGKNQSVKVIVSTYIAIVAGQGIGTFLTQTAPFAKSVLQPYGFSIDITLFGGAKLLIFLTTVIFIAARGGLEIAYAKSFSTMADVAMTALFGFATAGLLLSTLLTFIGNSPFLDPALANTVLLSPIIKQSTFMYIMIAYQGVWFALPALLLIIIGFLSYE